MLGSATVSPSLIASRGGEEPPPSALKRDGEGEGVWVLTGKSVAVVQPAPAREPVTADQLKRTVPSLAPGETTDLQLRFRTSPTAALRVDARRPVGLSERTARHILEGDAERGGAHYVDARLARQASGRRGVTWFRAEWSCTRILEVAHALAQDRSLPSQDAGAVYSGAAGSSSLGGYTLPRRACIAQACPDPQAQEPAWQPVKVVYEVQPDGKAAGGRRTVVTAYPVTKAEQDAFIDQLNGKPGASGRK